MLHIMLDSNCQMDADMPNMWAADLKQHAENHVAHDTELFAGEPYLHLKDCGVQVALGCSEGAAYREGPADIRCEAPAC